MKDIYKNLLKVAYDHKLVLNLIQEDSTKEAWFIYNGIKFIYRHWKIDEFLEIEAIYRKIHGMEMKLLNDQEVKMLYNSLKEINFVIKEK